MSRPGFQAVTNRIRSHQPVPTRKFSVVSGNMAVSLGCPKACHAAVLQPKRHLVSLLMDFTIRGTATGATAGQTGRKGTVRQEVSDRGHATVQGKGKSSRPLSRPEYEIGGNFPQPIHRKNFAERRGKQAEDSDPGGAIVQDQVIASTPGFIGPFSGAAILIPGH